MILVVVIVLTPIPRKSGNRYPATASPAMPAQNACPPNTSSPPNISTATPKSSKDPVSPSLSGQDYSSPSWKKENHLIIKIGAFVTNVKTNTNLLESSSEFLTLAIPQAPHLQGGAFLFK